ncbi:nuclear transport factor 2 family protein [Phormidium sp. LEGE 05292]|uniref:nuclear transport factor 2 family protein n=1 Tax=[Phormidium] sp. LEGE 05292 TaxID=767427 RepID=UPI00187F3768|nr:nuclear transport factor 2 family protein [Phormidium sp. LEGE 05292]MBE9226638.1 nuclear transport factor 2 family protein [Phormidium sp. LEGE 05292]
MASETAEKFMQTLQQIESNKNVEPLVSLFTEDAQLSNLATPSPLQGKDGARQFWQKYLSVFQQINSKFTNVVESNGSAVLEWISEGTLTSGEPLKYQGVSIIETVDGKVQRFRTYYDSAAFLPQGAKQ